MPLKWKLFRVVNLMQMAITVTPLLAIYLYIAVNRVRVFNGDLFGIYTGVVTLIVALNIANLHLLYR